MLPTATIVFREMLEIALLLGIIMAATRGLPQRLWLAVSGLAIGLCGAVIIAFFTNAISNAIDGVGQEVFNAIIMFIAVGFLSWTVIWMKRHGREMSQHLRQVGADVVAGKRSLYLITGVIALSTFREGSEVVLFTYGMLLSGQNTLSSVLAGGALGLAGGAIVGLLLYYGLLKTTKKYLLTVTSWMLILLTAGMAAQGAGFLVAADILPSLGAELWDSSEWISGSSLLGRTLGVLVGYTPRPSGIELLFYVSVVVVIGGLLALSGRRPRQIAISASA